MRGKRVYSLWQCFNDTDEFDTFWKDEKQNWVIDFKAKLKSGEVEYYTCKYGSRAKGRGNKGTNKYFNHKYSLQLYFRIRLQSAPKSFVLGRK